MKYVIGLLTALTLLIAYGQYSLMNEVGQIPTVYVMQTSKIFSASSYANPSEMQETINFAKQYAARLGYRGDVVITDDSLIAYPQNAQFISFNEIRQEFFKFKASQPLQQATVQQQALQQNQVQYDVQR